MTTNQPRVNLSEDVHFFYEFVLGDTVPQHQKASMLSLLDKKVRAAKEFLNYLSGVERKNQAVSLVEYPREYSAIQKELSAEIVHGKTFLKLNTDFNHTTYEVDDTKREKKRMEEEINKCTTGADESKKRFHEAVEELGKKASQLDTTSIAKFDIKDPALNVHFVKACQWILDVYYDTPASKFTWENFKKQTLVADKGEDFKRRIRGVYIPKLYDYQIETTHYVASMRPMFKQLNNDNNWDLVLSTAEDIINAYNARQEYTRCKKTISENKTKVIQAHLDLEQSEKISNTTRPFIKSVYEKLISKEDLVRDINLSDFCVDNHRQYHFQRGAGGRVAPCLRGEALAKFGEVDDGKEKKTEKKGAEVAVKKGQPQTEGKSADAHVGRPLGDKMDKDRVYISPSDIKAEHTAHNSPDKYPQGNKQVQLNYEYDDEIVMEGVD